MTVRESPSVDRPVGPPLALAVACILWGSAFYFGKLALVELSALEVTVWRFGLAGPVLVLLLVRKPHRLTRADGLLVVLTGILCVPIGYLVHFEGLERTSATHAALLVGIGPPLLAVSATVLGLERLRGWDWLAVVLSSAGVVLMVGIPGAGGDLVGDLLVVVSMVIATAWVLLSQRLTRRLGATVATAWILLTGTLALVPIVLVTGPPPLHMSPTTWGALAALSLGSTIGAFMLWNWGAGRLPAGRAGVFLNLEPVAGAFLGVTLLGDPLGVSLLAGGGVVLAASAMASAPRKVRRIALSVSWQRRGIPDAGLSVGSAAASLPGEDATDSEERAECYDGDLSVTCELG